MTVFFENETEREFPFNPEEQAKKVISFVCDHENCPYETEVSVTIVEKETIREINAEHRQVDRVTDVLSFPMMEYDTPGGFEGQAFDDFSGKRGTGAWGHRFVLRCDRRTGGRIRTFGIARI